MTKKETNKFTKAALAATTLSPILEGREKVTQKDVIRNYPDGITVTEFDIMHGKDKKGNDTVYPVLAFQEDPKSCFFGGTVLMNIVNDWVKMYDGDIEKASADLKEAGGVKMKLELGETKDGNSVTNVTIVED